MMCSPLNQPFNFFSYYAYFEFAASQGLNFLNESTRVIKSVTVPCLRRLVACVSTTESGFDPRPVRVILVVGEVALDTLCL